VMYPTNSVQRMIALSCLAVFFVQSFYVVVRRRGVAVR